MPEVPPALERIAFLSIAERDLKALVAYTLVHKTQTKDVWRSAEIASLGFLLG